MVERRRGDLVFVTSDVVAHPRPRMSAYVTSKWALEGFVTALQMELEGTGVRAVIVRPGPTQTGMGTDWDPDVTAEVITEWVHWGLARHSALLRPDGVALAIAHAVAAPAGHPPQRGGGPAGGAVEHGGSTVTTDTTLREPPRVSGGKGENAHLDEFSHDPIALMARVRAECGEVGEFTIGERDIVLLTGADANEFYFRAPEEQLDQAEAYPFMTPIFGKGVVFDAPPERRREMLHNQALRDKFMRGHAATIAAEVEQMVEGWGDEGEIDLLEWFAELTIYTSSACLIGQRFRRDLDGRFARLYQDLERGTDPIAYVDPYADIESFRRRDAARVALVDLVGGIMDRRRRGPRRHRRARRTCSTSSCRSGRRTGRPASAPTPSPGCSSP